MFSDKFRITIASFPDREELIAEIFYDHESNDRGHFPFGKVSNELPRIGLEPTHLAAPEPKSGVSTNFTTWALL